MKSIEVSTFINAHRDKVWECFTSPSHIVNWNFASDDWHCPSVENKLEVGAQFNWRMEVKDGSMGFDFSGIYEEVDSKKRIVYKLLDNRGVAIEFQDIDGGTKVVEQFEAEGTNQDEMQRQGWQAILNNFKKYVEAQN